MIVQFAEKLTKYLPNAEPGIVRIKTVNFVTHRCSGELESICI